MIYCNYIIEITIILTISCHLHNQRNDTWSMVRIIILSIITIIISIIVIMMSIIMIMILI